MYLNFREFETAIHSHQKFATFRHRHSEILSIINLASFFCQLFPLSPVVNAKLNTHCITPRIYRKPFSFGKVFHIVDPMLSSASKMVPHWLKRSRTSICWAWFHGPRNPKNVSHAFFDGVKHWKREGKRMWRCHVFSLSWGFSSQREQKLQLQGHHPQVLLNTDP